MDQSATQECYENITSVRDNNNNNSNDKCADGFSSKKSLASFLASVQYISENHSRSIMKNTFKSLSEIKGTREKMSKPSLVFSYADQLGRKILGDSLAMIHKDSTKLIETYSKDFSMKILESVFIDLGWKNIDRYESKVNEETASKRDGMSGFINTIIHDARRDALETLEKSIRKENAINSTWFEKTKQIEAIDKEQNQIEDITKSTYFLI